MTKPITLIALCTMGLAACQPTKPVTPPTVVTTGCEHFKKISASRLDTKQTRTEIQAHNAEYIKVCESKGKS